MPWYLLHAIDQSPPLVASPALDGDLGACLLVEMYPLGRGGFGRPCAMVTDLVGVRAV